MKGISMHSLKASNLAPMGESPVADMVALLQSRAAQQAEAAAYTFLASGEIDRPSHLTYMELDCRARAIAARLQAMAEPGQRALLLYPPGLDYIEAFFGCLYAGIIAVPAYPPSRQHSARLKAVIADATPTIFMTTAERVTKFKDDLVGCAVRTNVPYQWLATDTLASEEAERWQPPALTPDDLAFLQYTSGSTGDPKGVMVSHGNLLANQAVIQQRFGHTEDSAVVGWLPLYHDLGLIGNLLQPLYLGSGAILMSPLAFLAKPVRWLKAISVYRGATAGGPNFAYDLCVHKIDAKQKRGLDLSSWTLAFNSAEPVRAATMERFAQAFADCGFRRESFFPSYGLAEATLFITGTHRETADSALSPQERAKPQVKPNGEERPVSCGFTTADHDVCIVHPESGNPCREGETGEIWVAGPSVAQGYWNRPEESNKIFRARLNRPFSTEGEDEKGGSQENDTTYLRTGDLGFITAGQLHITGRIKDLIIIRGRNYYPQDIERTLTDHIKALRPDGCAAFGVTRQGEEGVVVVADVTRHTFRQKQFEPIIDAMRRILAEEWELAAVDLVLVPPGVVPKTSSGKLRRSACKQAYENDELPVLACASEQAHSLNRATGELTAPGTRQPEQEPEFQLLQAALSAVPQAQRAPLIARFIRTKASQILGMKETALAPDLSLRSFGLDSLKLVEIKHAVDQLLGIEAPLSLFLSDRTLAEVAEALAGDTPEQGPEPNGVGRATRTVAINPPSREEYRLSATQRAMWSVQQLEPNSAVYNLYLALRIEGALQPERVQQAFDQLRNHHDQLRMSYPMVDGAVVQVPLAPNDWPDYFTSINASDWTEADLQADLTRRISRPFDLANGDVLHIACYCLNEQQHILLFCAHHIAVDLRSVLILLDDLKSLLDDSASGEEPRRLEAAPTSYRDFVTWQQSYLQSSISKTDQEYWRTQLAGTLPILALPVDFPRPPVPTYRGASHAFQLDRKLTEKLKQLGRQYGATVFMTLLAVYKVLLYRYTHQQDLIVGTASSGRPQAHFMNMVGNFVNPIALRSYPKPTLTFAGYLRQIRGIVSEGLSHTDYPFSLLVEQLQPERSADHWPIYQTWFGSIVRTVLYPVAVGRGLPVSENGVYDNAIF